MSFKLHRDNPPREPRRRIPLIGVILMGIGAVTVVYLLITYGLMPLLAMLTPKG